MRTFALLCFTVFLTWIVGHDFHTPIQRWVDIGPGGKVVACLSFLGFFAAPVYLLEWWMEWRQKLNPPWPLALPKGVNRRMIVLSRSGTLRRIFRGLQLHRLYNAWLTMFPRIRSLPGSNVVYRARRTESVSLALEMLEGGNVYDGALLPADFTTFADIGCNVGYFTCLLAHHAGGRPIKGLMVDANERVIKEAVWHANRNRLDVEALHGVVGSGALGPTADFYLYQSDTCSTAKPEARVARQFKRITVPVLTLTEDWRRRFGSSRCHVLKVDIEGSELVFLQSEMEFLRRVDCIIIEWHSHRVSFEEVRAFLVGQGFQLIKIMDGTAAADGTACFKRK